MSFDEIELKTIECTLKRVSSMFQFKAGSDNILISNYAKFYHYSFDNKYGAVIEENLVYILSGALHFPNYELVNNFYEIYFFLEFQEEFQASDPVLEIGSDPWASLIVFL